VKLLESARALKERAEARSQDAHVEENYMRHQESRATFERTLGTLQTMEELANATRDAHIGVVTTGEDQEWARGIATRVEEGITTASGYELDRLSREAELAVDTMSGQANSRFESVLDRWGERQALPSDHVVDLLGRYDAGAAERTRQCVRGVCKSCSSMPRKTLRASRNLLRQRVILKARMQRSLAWRRV
jgi:hypothetical protein